jgi:conjugative relaxase-like TrwC/TraI family protein
MLTIHTCTSAAAVKAYYQSADYFVDGRQSPGEWGGNAAQQLGLNGKVQWEQFAAMAENRDPATGSRLTPRQNDSRRVAYDFTFSAPKSVSLLWEFTRDDRIREAFEQSVNDTMQELEAEAKTRVRKGKAEHDRTTSNLAWAGFTHFETRPSREDGLPDPQLHRHVVAFNLTWDSSEGRWKAAQFGDIKREAYYFEAAFHSRLSHRMRQLGYGIERRGRFWEVSGIPDELRERFSRRTHEIDELADELGITDPKARAKLGATSRLHKQKDISHEGLRSYWLGRLSRADKDALNSTVRNAADQFEGVLAMVPASPQQSLDHAFAHSFEREAVVPARRVLAEALRHGVGNLLPEQVLPLATQHGLVVRDVEGQQLSTTREVLDEESRMITFAREGRGTMRPLSMNDQFANPRKSENRLSPDQQAAILHVWNSRNRVTLVRGGAGTGKTTMMQAAIAGIEAPVVVIAPSARASRDVLRSEGFAEADTVARFLLDESMQRKARGGVIWVDEAGLVGSRDMAGILAVAEREGSRVVLQGDVKQHASVARGSPLQILADHAGLPVAELTDIKRQRGDYRTAIERLANGEAAEGFDQLDRLGWVLEVPQAERYQHLAAAYLATIEGGESAIIVSPTHAEGRLIARQVRRGLRQSGKLRGEDREFATFTNLNFTQAQLADARERGGEAGMVIDQYGAYREEPTTIASGDLVRITRGGKTADGKHRVENGGVYEVSGFTEAGGLQLANGWQLPPDFRFFTQGYVVTSHASQGRTVDRVFIGQSSESFPASSREQFYVSASRGRKQALVFTDDKTLLRHAVQHSEPRVSATDLMKKPKRRKARERLKQAARVVIDKTRELLQPSHAKERDHDR